MLGFGGRDTDPRLVDFLEADDGDGAASRAATWAFEDPFPKVARSLLSAVAIRNYARVTGMIHPFLDDRIKAASYEVGMGGTFILWKDGARHDQPIHALGSITLPANSISFIQTGVTFRLPHYMALRFNLQIAHVHRGILLGTGPLVDPGFEGVLLIPLHNLTSSPYTIPLTEPLIWVEFTKTTFGQTKIGRGYDETCLPNFLFPERKKNKTPDYYLDRANKGHAIASSIPDVIAQSAADARLSADRAEEAKQASADAKTLAESADKKLFRIGLGGAVAAIVAVAAIYLTALSVIHDAASAVHDADAIIDQAEQTERAREKEARDFRDAIGRIRVLEMNNQSNSSNSQTGLSAENGAQAVDNERGVTPPPSAAPR